MITRRLALFRIATASAVAATAASPVALAAIQSKTPEDPALLRLGRKLEKLDAIRQYRAKMRAVASTAYDAARPTIPSELLVTPRTKHVADSKQERDWAKEVIWPDDPTKPPRRYHAADNIRDAIEGYTSMAREEGDTLEEYPGYIVMSQLLPIAEQYEQETEAAIDASSIREASANYCLAAQTIERIAKRIAVVPARTPDGITIKARAYEALAACGETHRDRSAQIIGPRLAEDICRVLSEGGAA